MPPKPGVNSRIRISSAGSFGSSACLSLCCWHCPRSSRYFENLPRFAPVVQHIQNRLFFDEGNRLLGLFSLKDIDPPDVVLSPAAYWYAVIVWLFGIWCGVMTVKLLLVVSDQFASQTRLQFRSIVHYVLYATAVFAFLSLAVYDENAFVSRIPIFRDYQGIAPGVAILALMAIVALVSALFSLFFELILDGKWSRWRLPALLVPVAFIAWNNSTPDSYQFENLNYAAPSDAPGPFLVDLAKQTGGIYQLKPQSPAPNAPLKPLVLDKDARPVEAAVPRERVLAGEPFQAGGRLYQRRGDPGWLLDGDSPRSAGTGSRLRDGYVEARFSHPRPHHHGRPGGMACASYYVAWLRERLGDLPAPGAIALPTEDFAKAIPIFGLSPVARSIALRNPLETTFRRVFNWFGSYPDRGKEARAGLARPPLSDVRPPEQGGEGTATFADLFADDRRGRTTPAHQ